MYMASKLQEGVMLGPKGPRSDISSFCSTNLANM